MQKKKRRAIRIHFEQMICFLICIVLGKHGTVAAAALAANEEGGRTPVRLFRYSVDVNGCSCWFFVAVAIVVVVVVVLVVHVICSQITCGVK